MSFFIRNAGGNRKRKPPAPGGGGGGGSGGSGSGGILKNSKKPKKQFIKSKPTKASKDDVIESDEEVASDDGDVAEDVHLSDVEATEEDLETAQEKKVRLAKRLLQDLKAREEDKAADEALIHDAISHRLKSDLDDEKGRRVRPVADEVFIPPSSDHEDVKVLNKNGKGHGRSVTSVVLSPNAKWVFSAGKDGRIVKWDVMTASRAGVIERAAKPASKKGAKGKSKKKNSALGIAKAHSGIILCLAISSDSRFLASGDDKNLVLIWDPKSLAHLHTFKGHRGPVNGLGFQRCSTELFSCSTDRCVKVWNCDQMSYVETLYGHQEAIMGVDSFVKERALTAGGSDASCRVWKIVEESQLVFNAGSSGSLDCLAFINEDFWVTGSDEGGLALWTVGKKKPLTQFAKAHSGLNLRSKWTPEGVEPPATLAHWISAVAAAPCSNLVASGSSDGHIRLWKCGEGFKHLTRLKSTIQVPGFVNSLKFSEDGSTLVAGVGQEHRLGRWWRIAEAKNSIWVVKLRKKEEVEEKMNGVKLMNGGPTLVNGKDDSESDDDEEEDDEEDDDEDEDDENNDEDDDDEDNDNEEEDGEEDDDDSEESEEEESGEDDSDELEEEGETPKLIDEKNKSVETAEPTSLDVLQNGDAATATECDTTPDAGNLSPVTEEDVGDEGKLNSEPVDDVEKMDVEESVNQDSQVVVETENAAIEAQTSDNVNAPETVEENEVEHEKADEEIGEV